MKVITSFASVLKDCYMSIRLISAYYVIEDLPAFVQNLYMILLGLSLVTLILQELLIISCRCGKAFGHCSSVSRSGSRYFNAISAVWLDHFDCLSVWAWYAMAKSKLIFSHLKIVFYNFDIKHWSWLNKIMYRRPNLLNSAVWEVW